MGRSGVTRAHLRCSTFLTSVGLSRHTSVPALSPQYSSTSPTYTATHRQCVCVCGVCACVCACVCVCVCMCVCACACACVCVCVCVCAWCVCVRVRVHVCVCMSVCAWYTTRDPSRSEILVIVPFARHERFSLTVTFSWPVYNGILCNARNSPSSKSYTRTSREHGS